MWSFLDLNLDFSLFGSAHGGLASGKRCLGTRGAGKWRCVQVVEVH